MSEPRSPSEPLARADARPAGLRGDPHPLSVCVGNGDRFAVLDRLLQKLFVRQDPRQRFLSALAERLAPLSLPQRHTVTAILTGLLTRLATKRLTAPGETPAVLEAILTLMSYNLHAVPAPSGTWAAAVTGEALTLQTGETNLQSLAARRLLSELTAFDVLVKETLYQSTGNPLTCKSLSEVLTQNARLAGRLLLLRLIHAPDPCVLCQAVGAQASDKDATPSAGEDAPKEGAGRLCLYLRAKSLPALLAQDLQELTHDLLTHETRTVPSAGEVKPLTLSVILTWALLHAAGLIAEPLTAGVFGEDGRRRRVDLWRVTKAAADELLRFWSVGQKKALAADAYAVLDLTFDHALARTLTGRTDTDITQALPLVPVLSGVVPLAGLTGWATGLITRTLTAIDRERRSAPTPADFYGVGLSTAHRRRLGFVEEDDPVAESVRDRNKDAEKDPDQTPSETAASPAAPCVRERIAQVRLLTAQYAAARAYTNTRSAAASALSTEIQAQRAPSRVPPAGLFVPTAAFAVDPKLWLAPLLALGLAEATDTEGLELLRYRAGAQKPEAGVVFALFESKASARFWLTPLVTGEKSQPLSPQASESSCRGALLKRFLRLDAMSRTLRRLAADALEVEKSTASRILTAAAPLSKEALTAEEYTALKTFLPAQTIKGLKNVTQLALVHSYLTVHAPAGAGALPGAPASVTSTQGEDAGAQALDSLLEASRTQRRAKMSRRLKRAQHPKG